MIVWTTTLQAASSLPPYFSPNHFVSQTEYINVNDFTQSDEVVKLVGTMIGGLDNDDPVDLSAVHPADISTEVGTPLFSGKFNLVAQQEEFVTACSLFEDK